MIRPNCTVVISNFQKFSGEGRAPSPLPRPLPPLHLGLQPSDRASPEFSGTSIRAIALSIFGPPLSKILDPPLDVQVMIVSASDRGELQAQRCYIVSLGRQTMTDSSQRQIEECNKQSKRVLYIGSVRSEYR